MVKVGVEDCDTLGVLLLVTDCVLEPLVVVVAVLLSEGKKAVNVYLPLPPPFRLTGIHPIYNPYCVSIS